MRKRNSCRPKVSVQNRFKITKDKLQDFVPFFTRAERAMLGDLLDIGCKLYFPSIGRKAIYWAIFEPESLFIFTFTSRRLYVDQVRYFERRGFTHRHFDNPTYEQVLEEIYLQTCLAMERNGDNRRLKKYL